MNTPTKIFCLCAVSFFQLDRCLPSIANDSSDAMAVLQESKPLVTRAGAWHTWGDRFHLRPGQEKLPLRLTFTNGADGRPKATDLKVFLDNKPFATFKDFNGRDNFSTDLTGKLHSGNTTFKVQGFGPSGARMNWKLYIQRPVIESVNPNPISAAGTITIQGKNFSDRAEQVKVYVANKQAKPVSSKEQEVQFKLPAHVPSGPQQLTVAVNYVHSSPVSVSVRSIPHIKWIDMLASPPQHPVTISGSGFSSVVSENVVTFGTVKARVVSATESSITCIIPDMQFPRWHVPIKVTTNGLASKEKAHIHVDVRVVPNEGIPMH